MKTSSLISMWLKPGTASCINAYCILVWLECIPCFTVQLLANKRLSSIYNSQSKAVFHWSHIYEYAPIMFTLDIVAVMCSFAFNLNAAMLLLLSSVLTPVTAGAGAPGIIEPGWVGDKVDCVIMVGWPYWESHWLGVPMYDGRWPLGDMHDGPPFGIPCIPWPLCDCVT